MSTNNHLIAGQSALSAIPEADAQRGDEPMTPKQAAILRELAEDAGEPFDGALTQAQARERIEYLKNR